MYKNTSRFQLSRAYLLDKYQVNPKTFRDECKNFAYDYIFYEQYLQMLANLLKQVIFENQLSPNQNKLAAQMRSLCSVELYGFKILESLKGADERVCELFINEAIPELTKISKRALEANELLHLICITYPENIVKDIRQYVHIAMLEIARKKWPNMTLKQVKQAYLDYGIK